MKKTSYNVQSLGPLTTQLAHMPDSHQAVQLVLETMRDLLKMRRLVFTIAQCSQSWRIKPTSRTHFKSPLDAIASAKALGLLQPASYKTVCWAANPTAAGSSASQQAQGMLVWSEPQNALASATGKALLDLLRLTARLFASEHTVAQLKITKPSTTEIFATAQGRQRFVDVAAHALRSPITTLRMQIENIERKLRLSSPAVPLDADQLAQRMQRAVGQCDALVRLSDDLLDVCTLQHNPLELSLSCMDLTALVQRVCMHFQDRAQHAQCTLILDAEGPVLGFWDALYLERAVANLVDNAIRYAPGAPVCLSIRKDVVRAHLTVQDSGPGIAASDRARLFGGFERGQNVLNSGGWGLGLYLARHIVEAHEGRIEIAQPASHGCTMQVALPLRAG